MLDNVYKKGGKCEAKEGRKRREVTVLMGDPGEGSEADQLSAEAQTWGEVQKVASGSNGRGGAHLLIAARWFAPIGLVVKDKTWGKGRITCVIRMIMLRLRAIFTCTLQPAS